MNPGKQWPTLAGMSSKTHSFLDGVYADRTHGSRTRFRRVRAPTSDELSQLTHIIAQRIARYLQRQGLLERDVESYYLTAEAVDAVYETPMNQLLGSSITYRIAVGPQQGRKVFSLNAGNAGKARRS